MLIAMSAKKQGGKGTAFQYIKGINAINAVETKEFSFAEPLKRLAVDVLGLREEQAFGTDAEKNTIVPHLLWENFPVPAYRTTDGTVFIVQGYYQDSAMVPLGESSVYDYRSLVPTNGKVMVGRKTGPMTGREVLQFWGTEIYRRAYGPVWAEACVRKATKWLEGPTRTRRVAVITDTRFPDEVETVRGAGGVVVRNTRNPFNDQHSSETALDGYTAYDFVNDNADLGMAQSCLNMHSFLLQHGVIEDVPARFREIVLAEIESK